MEKQTYSVRLATGRSWRLESTPATAGWLGRFAVHVGAESGGRPFSAAITVVMPQEWRGLLSGFSIGANGPVPARGWRRRWLPGADLYRRAGSHDVVCVLRGAPSPDCEPEQMRYVLYPFLSGAVNDGGLPLHAALVERDGVGFLISAASGVGKSTNCRRLPPPWRTLSDDMSLVVPAAKGGWRAHSLPTWSAIKSGTPQWPCLINASIPVKALFFLIRSEMDGVEPLGQGTATLGITDGAGVCFHYLDPYFHEANQRPLRRRIFENGASLAATLPSYALRASLNGRFWEYIEEVLNAQRDADPVRRAARETQAAVVSGGGKGS
jgi:SynChlorMet cassette protein ScmC